MLSTVPIRPQTTGPWQVSRDGEPVSPLLPGDADAFGWLLRHQPMSTDWAVRYEGYAYGPVEGVEPWHSEATGLSVLARQQFRHRHAGRFADEVEETLVRDNCGACRLEGWRELPVPAGTLDADDDELTGSPRPGISNWTRTYVEAGRAVPSRWRAEFVSVLNEGTPHAAALARSLRTFGVVFRD